LNKQGKLYLVIFELSCGIGRSWCRLAWEWRLLRSEDAVESVARFVILGTVWRYDKGPRGVRYALSLDTLSGLKAAYTTLWC
jgi:hypothetical protein